MPVYEFICSECLAKFEQLCRLNWQGAVHCPSCGSANLRKAISGFCSPGGSGGSSCGSCSSKNCGSCR